MGFLLGIVNRYVNIFYVNIFYASLFYSSLFYTGGEFVGTDRDWIDLRISADDWNDIVDRCILVQTIGRHIYAVSSRFYISYYTGIFGRSNL